MMNYASGQERGDQIVCWKEGPSETKILVRHVTGFFMQFFLIFHNGIEEPAVLFVGASSLSILPSLSSIAATSALCSLGCTPRDKQSTCNAIGSGAGVSGRRSPQKRDPKQRDYAGIGRWAQGEVKCAEMHA